MKALTVKVNDHILWDGYNLDEVLTFLNGAGSHHEFGGVEGLFIEETRFGGEMTTQTHVKEGKIIAKMGDAFEVFQKE